MGITVDTEALFGVDMATAFARVRDRQKPIASLHALPPSTDANAARERGAASASFFQGNAGACAGAEDVLKFQRGHVMERRHIAEHLGDPSNTPPNTAMSLGECVHA
jgi:hypothetical protein